MTPLNVIELRQYTLHPGRRDELIELFERELVETQEAGGMVAIGQFRDLDDPDRFVWMRGFRDMPARKRALESFYYGPVWAEHGGKASATMADSSDARLLRPVTPDSGFAVDPADRPPVGSPAPDTRIYATLWKTGFTGLTPEPFAVLSTLKVQNNFERLPIRTDFGVVIAFTRGEPLDADPAPVQTLRLAPTGRSLIR